MLQQFQCSVEEIRNRFEHGHIIADILCLIFEVGRVPINITNNFVSLYTVFLSLHCTHTAQLAYVLHFHKRAWIELK